MNFIVVMFLLTLAMTTAKPPPTQEAIKRCEAIGESSGCSGCVASTVDCDWCTAPGDQSIGACLPQSHCGTIFDATDHPYISNAKLCPLDATKERPYTGRDLLYAKSTSKTIANQDDLRFTPFFDSHYCEFPVTPWPVDRSIGIKVQDRCERVNTELAVGQRQAIDKCLRDQQAGTLNARRQECLRIYQSLLCTIMCPEYGVAMDFQNLCPSVCARLDQVCGQDTAMANCLDVALGIPMSCASVEDEGCYRPRLIDVGGRFEFDLCFFGDPKRCSGNVDCSVALEDDTTKWPVAFQSGDDAVHFDPAQTGPFCCAFDTWYWWLNGGFSDAFDPVGFLLKITTPASGDGLSCQEAAKNLIIDKFGTQVGFEGSRTEIHVACTASQCAAGFILWFQGYDHGDVPVDVYHGCAPSESKNCPGVIETMFP